MTNKTVVSGGRKVGTHSRSRSEPVLTEASGEWEYCMCLKTVHVATPSSVSYKARVLNNCSRQHRRMKLCGEDLPRALPSKG